MAQGTLLFIHGTGVRDVSDSMQRIRDGAKRYLALAPDHVHAIEWGKAVGPEDLDIKRVLPPDPITRGMTLAGSDIDVDTAMWGLLFADPLLELRFLSNIPQAGSGTQIAFAQYPVDVLAQRQVIGLTLPTEVLEAAQIDSTEIVEACRAVGESEEFPAAAVACGTWNAPELVNAVARAVTATVVSAQLQRLMESRLYVMPRVVADGEVRAGLVTAIEKAYAPDVTKGVISEYLAKMFGPLAQKLGTKVAVDHRGQFMGPLSDFIRDVAWYIARGADARDFIRAEMVPFATRGPVVVLAHSLGGIAAVDLLSDPAIMTGPQPPRVDTLVTVGSQAPLLYLLDALKNLRPPPNPTVVPFSPWINIYNRQDLLSFFASGVFRPIPGGQSNAAVKDFAIDPGVPFPQSHSAYWDSPQLYKILRDYWP